MRTAVVSPRQANVYGFDISSGQLLMSYEGLHDQPVTSCVYLPDADLLITTSMDTCAVVRSDASVSCVNHA